MRLTDRNCCWLVWGLGGILALSGCGGTIVKLDSDQHANMLREDRAFVGQSGASQQKIELSVEQAVQRGLTRNLDARVAALEELSQQDSVTLAQLQALPGVEASGGYVKRSNPGASSSRSVITGQQSLEPSQSTETDRRVAALEASWNLLDAGLALADAARADEEAKVSAERYAKVIQNVERDVYAAYWRALAYQDAKLRTAALIDEMTSQIQKLDRAANEKLLSGDEAGEKMAVLSDRVRILQDLRGQMQLSEIELKSMISIPLDAELVLTTRRRDTAAAVEKIIGEDVASQEWDALQNRPEMREEILNKNITLRDTRREIFQTLPGAELLFSREYDSNKFLVDSTWSNFSAKVVQSLTAVLTLPERYKAAKNKEAVADARRQALSSAILAQVHIARQRLQSLEQTSVSSRLAQKAATRKSHALSGKAAEGLASSQEALLARMDAQVESMRAALLYADVQDAYVALKNTIGRRVVDTPVKIAMKEGGAQ